MTVARRRTRRSAMNFDFTRHSLDHDWLSFIGQPMLYDGALFVEREPAGVSQHRLLQSIPQSNRGSEKIDSKNR